MTEKSMGDIIMFAVHSNKRAYENDLVNYYDGDYRSYPAKRFRPSPTLKRQREDDTMDTEPKRTCIYQPLSQPLIPYTPNNFIPQQEAFTINPIIQLNSDVYFPLLKQMPERIDPEHGQLVLWRPQ